MFKDSRILLRGRLKGITARQAASLAEWRGARIVRRRSSATFCVVAHSCAATWGEASFEEIGAPVISELAFCRAVGLRPELPPEARPYSADDVAAHANLPSATLRDLVVFDVLDAVDGRFGFRDIAVAREARRLLDDGVALSAILETGSALRTRGIRLNAAALQETPWGELLTCDGEDLVSLDGQLELQLGEPRVRFEDVFDVAEECEAEGDLDEAERLYRLAAGLDRSDAHALFNLGNILVAQGRADEALASFLRAAERDRAIAADALYNVAILHRRRGALDTAERAYLAAIRSDPGHQDARHNLALLLSEQRRFDEAVHLWDSLAAEGSHVARLQASLCRMELLALRA
jgi:tetratricopeptide (TPR) repeat protein